MDVEFCVRDIERVEGWVVESRVIRKYYSVSGW